MTRRCPAKHSSFAGAAVAPDVAPALVLALVPVPRNPDKVAQTLVVLVVIDSYVSGPPCASFYVSLCASGDDTKVDRMWSYI